MPFKFNQQQFKWTSHLKLLLPLVLFIFVSLKPAAQVINIDGHAGDWAGKTYNAYSHDRNNSSDNQFTQGAKDGDAIAAWHWSDGQTNNKGDITNAAAILGTEMVGGVSHNFIYFAGDRAVNNGDAAIGFWFFKGGVSLDTTGGSAGSYQGVFSGVHQNGDLLVVSHFTGGGGTADIFIYKWQGTGLLAPVTSTTAAVNSLSENIPTGFSYASASYPIGDFFEGKVDLTNLGVPPCFTNFLLETRNSQSITASLQDLTFGSFTLSVDAPGATYITPLCTESTFKVQVTSPQVGSSYRLTQSDNNVVTIGPYASGNLIFTGLHAGQGYSLVLINANGCTSGPTTCVVPVSGAVVSKSDATKVSTTSSQ
jgi:hypothetical protein